MKKLLITLGIMACCGIIAVVIAQNEPPMEAPPSTQQTQAMFDLGDQADLDAAGKRFSDSPEGQKLREETLERLRREFRQ